MADDRLDDPGPARSGFGADDVIGGYELLRRIGSGGMAEVWVARKRTNKGKFVALKVILPHLAGDSRFTKMFASEAELSSLLSHSNIVQVFDVGQDEGIDFLVMEWVDGVNLVGLREALAGVEFGERVEIAAFVVGQLLHALSYAHSITSQEGHGLGIVHRDVSPQNILVSNAGDVKLTDFGVAHTVIDESSGMHIKGKLRYMAPEQAAGQTRARTVDLYAAGAILHELITATRYRDGIDDVRVLHGQVLGGSVPEMTQPIPPQLEAVRQALLAADARDRVQSADAALEQLARFEGYRDKRRAVSRLCGSLTGVYRPRTGPGAERLTPAAALAAPAGARAAAAGPWGAPPGGAVARSSDPWGPGRRGEGRAGAAEGANAADLGGPRIYPPTVSVDMPAALEAPPRPESRERLAEPRAVRPPPPGMSRPLVAGLVTGVLGLGVALGSSRLGCGPTDGGSPVGMSSSRTPVGVEDDEPAPAESEPDPVATNRAPQDAELASPRAAQSSAPLEGPAVGEAVVDAGLAPREADREVEPGDAVAPSSVATPARADALPTEPGTTSEPKPKPAGSGDAKPSPRTRASGSKPKGPPVLVHLRLENVTVGWIKLGQRSLSIGAASSLKLPSGRYTAYKKHAESDRYTRCGVLRLQAGKEWKVFVGPTRCRAEAFER